MACRTFRNTVRWAVAIGVLICGCRRSQDGLALTAPGGRVVPTALDDCLARIDSSDGTRPQDCLPLVNLDGGIDAREATAIARAFFAHNGPEFGAAGPATRDGGDWFCVAYVGTSLAPALDPIRINGMTGAVSHRVFGAFSSLDELRAAMPPRRRTLGRPDGRSSSPEMTLQRR